MSLSKFFLGDLFHGRQLKGLAIVRRDTPYKLKPLIYKPQIILLAQGKKNVYLDNKVYTYDSHNYFVLTVPLPVMCEAIIEEKNQCLEW